MNALGIHPGFPFMPTPEARPRVIGAMLGVSVGLHLAFILAIGLRISPSFQPPLASYQVALVSLREPQAPAQTLSPAVPPVQPTPSRPQPQRELKPAPTVQVPAVPKSVTQEVQAARSVPVPPKPSTSALVVREALRGLELPPEAPTLTEPVPAFSTSPKRSTRSEPKRLREEIDTLMANLAVPTAPVKPAPAQATPPAQVKPALSEELRKQLQDLQRPSPAEPSPMRPPDARPVQPERPAPAAAVPKKPTTSIEVPGAAPGLTLYLAQVQNKISRYWVAPNVGDFRELEGLQATVKFRLHQSGKVTDVVIEQSSGNPYYDLSGKRAVLSADPLPPFPPGLSEAYFDAHFRFVLGEKAG